MFIYFKLFLCIINPFVRLERYSDYGFLKDNDGIVVKKYTHSNKILSIKITKSSGEVGHKVWYFRPSFR
jgi:phage anti-repressor protein